MTIRNNRPQRLHTEVYSLSQYNPFRFQQLKEKDKSSLYLERERRLGMGEKKISKLLIVS